MGGASSGQSLSLKIEKLHCHLLAPFLMTEVHNEVGIWHRSVGAYYECSFLQLYIIFFLAS